MGGVYHQVELLCEQVEPVYSVVTLRYVQQVVVGGVNLQTQWPSTVGFQRCLAY